MNKSIKNFLKEINKLSKLTKVQLMKEDSTLDGDFKDSKNATFKISLKSDLFINGDDHGVNVSMFFINTVNDLCYKHFGKTAIWNNIRNIFWVYSDKI